MKKYLISIIIVSLNSKENFLETLNSVLNQNFSNREIIVVDGIFDAMNKGINLVLINYQ